MSVYVVDASVALKWYVPEAHSDDALRLLQPGNEIHVPDLLHAEGGNILWRKVRRGELSAAMARRIARALLAVPRSVHATAPLLDGALEIATRFDRTVRDAIYVVLALAVGAPLVTADRRLVSALERTQLRHSVLWVKDLP